jgi:hypothetical protein
MSPEIKSSPRLWLRIFLLLSTIAVVACGSKTPETPAVEFGPGFFAQEPLPDGSTFRWMGPQGTVYLKNEQRDMVVTIRFDVPPDRFAVPPDIRIEWNGTLLEELKAASGYVGRKLTIPAASQKTGDRSELRILTSQSFVPKDADPSSVDTRRLGLVVHGILWETK